MNVIPQALLRSVMMFIVVLMTAMGASAEDFHPTDVTDEICVEDVMHSLEATPSLIASFVKIELSDTAGSGDHNHHVHSCTTCYLPSTHIIDAGHGLTIATKAVKPVSDQLNTDTGLQVLFRPPRS